MRPCDEYEDEAKECKRIKARFHQYFIHGETTDCNPWFRDASNCTKCIDEKNTQACKDIIANESRRRLKRLQGHKNNDVWERRSEPPENWGSPLPGWWLKKNRNSLLISSLNDVEEYTAVNEPSSSFCSIL